MTTETKSEMQDALADLLDSLRMRGEAATGALPDGREIKLSLVPDHDAESPFDSDDFFGRIEYPSRHSETGREQRPSGFNGAARKLDTRDGFVWWQPPADLVSDAVNLEACRRRVQGYLHGDWAFMGVVVEIAGKSASVWGVETDADDAFLVELAGDLVSEIGETPVCPTCGQPVRS